MVSPRDDGTHVTGRNADVGQPGTTPDSRWVILTRGIKREYDMGGEIVRALRGVDLAIARNEYVAIMGPSGSGKSTFMNIIGCLDTPNAGEYWLANQEVSKMSDDALARIRNKEIGSALEISEETVRVHVKNLFAKLNTTDRTGAVNIALKRGIIHLQ